jgi:Nitroreductase
MNFETCIKERRSIRRFTEELVSKEEFKKIIELARFAPSWKNSQTARYTLVQDRTLLEAIANSAVLDFSYNTKTILAAPNLVILSTVTKESGYETDGSFTTSKGSTWEVFDAGIAAQTFCLAAHGYGYGTVIMGIYDDEKVKSIISLPANQTVSAIIALGVSAIDPVSTLRKSVEELIQFK